MLQHIHNVKKKIETGQSLIANPLEFFLDFLVRIIANLFVPIPIAAEILVEFRGVVTVLLLNFVLVVFVLFFVITGSLFSPFLAKGAHATGDNTITTSDCSKMSPTDIPQQNPFGGQGLSLVQITANFHDPSYFAEFHMQHEGVDFVPSPQYYQVNTTYKATGDVVICSTINGIVHYYVDGYGSNTVEVMNKDGTIKVIFMHLNKVFITTGTEVTAGTPVGTMGDTGFSTGEHLHYQIDLNENGTWTPVNPLGYIQ